MKLTDTKQVVTQNLRRVSTFISDKAIPSTQVASQHIKCVSPMISSQKLYKYKELEIAEEFEQAIEANSLEQINILLNKLVEPGEVR